ncbi:mixed lineage kinase domain-like protein [Scyliorhinus canicula]|uniref:mixed lineage kinase domain-like protein n=1 Tax=Scyliorhinus canicula TaxID=7830 RepID=UPI0018F37E65|nr:mixed lineage kinase domain-like protein [Scyliorhinus canicula]
MEYIPKIISLAADIYTHLRKVKLNKRQCERLCSRIKMLMISVNMVQNERSLKGHSVDNVLKELELTLQNAEGLVKSFTSWGSIKKVVRASNILEKFEHINDRLNDAAQQLILVLTASLSQTRDTFEEDTRKIEDRKDQQEDEESLNDISNAVKEDLPDECDNSANSQIQKSLEEITAEIKEIKTMMISNKKAASSPRMDGIREINMQELQKDSQPFQRTNTSMYYKGMFLKQPVVIKRFISESANIKKVQKTFMKEAETMNQFRSDNIVRIYGICMRREAHRSEFLIVMEYCERGNLKNALNSKKPLPWSTRVRMSLDTARGVYWLHQSQEKARLLCRVSSTSFLVNEDYRVKLAGLELTKTESSIRVNESTKKDSASEISYLSPQQYNDVNYPYDKECEVYSLGIVLWEISSCKTPFEGADLQRIRTLVYEERFLEPLPDDCPRDLVELINECRAFEPFERPSAGAVVDRLLQIQEKCKSA